MPKHLKLKPDFSDYSIFGLSTHEKDYKLCWYINSLLYLNLIRYPALRSGQNPEIGFSLFAQEEAYEQVDLFLLSNFDKHVPWFEKAAYFHYFFIIRGNPLKSQLEEISAALKNIPQMLLVTMLSSSEKKLALPLLTNFELHLTEINKSRNQIKKSKTPKRAGIKKSSQWHVDGQRN